MNRFAQSRWAGLYYLLRRRARMLRFAGRGAECNLCGWRGRRFADDGWHRGTMCPRCGSVVRHRLLAAALTRPGLEEFSLERLVRGRRVLHFAPEAVIRGLIEPAAGEYAAADLLAEGYRYPIHLRADISRMPEVRDASRDCVVACDVLEHVPDDRAALREIHRVLAPGGMAILTVPQKDAAAATEEDPFPADPRERERRFGQADHLRIYGEDFIARCEAAGFAVSAVDETRFAEAERRLYVLAPAEPSPRPLATNRRRVFFCRKAG